MDVDPTKRDQIIQTLESKAVLKQEIYNNTLDVFGMMKDILHEMSTEINEELTNTRLIKVEYRDRGKFEAQTQVAGDMLIFSMHTNVFKFSREHLINNNTYAQQDASNIYTGVINIYDFLSDSFKYNRTSDEGYLIARIFINHEKHFFVEGKRQHKYSCESFGTQKMSRELLMDIIESSILYALDFDLLAPPYDTQKIIALDQLNTKTENSKIQTGKRLGFMFNSDDV